MEKDLISVIEQVKGFISQKKYRECEALICTAMFEHPHDAVPHNLMGLLLEHENHHPEAMRHFRAAYDLDPTYGPAEWNLESFGGFAMYRTGAYFESDCGRCPPGRQKEGKN